MTLSSMRAPDFHRMQLRVRRRKMIDKLQLRSSPTPDGFGKSLDL